MGSAPKRFGGVGAVFFLATLGVISFYVQRQALPEAERELRKPVTNVAAGTAAPAEPAIPTLPWKDRLDLSALTLVPVQEPALPSVAPAAPAGTSPVATPDKPAADPATSLYVQELGDGHRLLYTLDPVLQESIEQIFRNREVPYAGAVALDLRDNSVLAMVGHSSHDPEVDPLEVVATAWAPAASVFKLVTTSALLDTGKVTPTSKKCFHDGLHGITDDLLVDNAKLDTRCNTLSTAVTRSLNVVIAKLALSHLDEPALRKAAHAFQFEKEIPFEFRVEPSPAHLPEDPNERAKVAAGFWQIDLSPVHGALLASILARDGVYQPPHVLAHILGPKDEDLTPSAANAQRVVAADVTAALRPMMVAVTTDGTAKESFVDRKGHQYIPQVDVAGKTGSLTGKRAPALNYNWFVGYAPAESPEIAFAIVLANEPKWRIKAHYVGRRIVQLYLDRREAITNNRSARLTRTGVVQPHRDQRTGAIVAKAEDPAATTDTVDKPTDADDATPLESLPDPSTALPPIPGPLPDPATPSPS